MNPLCQIGKESLKGPKLLLDILSWTDIFFFPHRRTCSLENKWHIMEVTICEDPTTF